MQRGFIKIWRKLRDSGLMQNANALAVFLHLLMEATHKQRKVGVTGGRVITLKRGQVITGRKRLAEQLNLTERKIRTAMGLLIGLEIVTSKATSTYSVVTVLNYNKYQSANPGATSIPTNERPATDQRATTKQELKNDKNTPVGTENDWNPFGLLMKVFKDHGVPVHTRSGGDIGVVNALGYKVGQDKFIAMSIAYCMDDFYRDIGRSAAGFTKAFNKLDDKVTKAKAPEQKTKEVWGKKYGGPITRKKDEQDITSEQLAEANRIRGVN